MTGGNGDAARARRLHDELPVVDGHNDLPWAIRSRAGGNLEAADPSGPLPRFHSDVTRLRAGGVGAQFWSVYVPSSTPEPLRATREQIRLVRLIAERDPARLAPAVTADDVVAIRRGGRTACLIGAEGGHCIEGSLTGLRELAGAGVRYMTLTHMDTTEWADSATDAPRHGGLSEFGVAVVDEMNRLGMLVDISHVSPDAMRRAVEASATAVIASHSNAYALAPHARNVPDDVLEMVAASGGVVMVTFFPGFLVPAAASTYTSIIEHARALMDRLGDEAAVDGWVASTIREELEPATVADVVDHIEYIARFCGVDHVGIGSDFDGMEAVPAGLEDVSGYPAITEELFARGWEESDVRRVLGENSLRVLREAEEVAATMR